MIGDSLPAAIGKDLNGSYGTLPGTDSPEPENCQPSNRCRIQAGPYTPQSTATR